MVTVFVRGSERVAIYRSPCQAINFSHVETLAEGENIDLKSPFRCLTVFGNDVEYRLAINYGLQFYELSKNFFN